MSGKIVVYEEPGMPLAVLPIADDPPIAEQAMAHLQGGLEQGRSVLALVFAESGGSEPVQIFPQDEAVALPFSEATEKVQSLLGEQKFFEAIRVVDAASRAEGADALELGMLLASLFEVTRIHEAAAPLLEMALPQVDGVRRHAVEMRLARARVYSGRKDSVEELVNSALTCTELPVEMRIEALLVRALTESKEQAMETLDELLDQAEEHLGDHRLAAEALEHLADLQRSSDPAKAQSYYLAAGKMLMRLRDPYFFGLNERLVVHMLSQQDWKGALHLAREMSEMLTQGQFPRIAQVPFLVFAAWAHDQLGDRDRCVYARKSAVEIDAQETLRVEANLKNALGLPVQTA